MKQHMTNSSSQTLEAGTQLQILAASISPGDQLAVEFPGNNRTKAAVLSNDGENIEIAVDDRKFRLVRIVPNERSASLPAAPGLDSSIWVVAG